MKSLQRKIGVKPDGEFGPITAKSLMGYLNLSLEEAAHFLGQSYLESGGFKRTSENLNYSKEGLLKVFGKYFDSETAEWYARKPEMIANRVYANRMGNGTEESGDGWKYRGRGYIQLTGKRNYELFCNHAENSKIIDNPNLVETDYPLESAKYYFYSNNIWRHCKTVDDNSILSVSRIINLGRANHPSQPNHLKERIFHTKRVYHWMK